MATCRALDPAARRRAVGIALAKRLRPGGDTKVIVIPGAARQIVKGAEILEMQPEIATAQLGPGLRPQGLAEGRRKISGQRCLLVATPDTLTGSQSAKAQPSPGAVTSTQTTASDSERNRRSARRRPASGRKLTMGTTCPRVRSESAGPPAGRPARKRSAKAETARCAPEEWPTIRTSSQGCRRASAMSWRNRASRSSIAGE